MTGCYPEWVRNWHPFCHGEDVVAEQVRWGKADVPTPCAPCFVWRSTRSSAPEGLLTGVSHTRAFLRPVEDDKNIDRAMFFWLAGEPAVEVQTSTPARLMQKHGWVCVGGVKGSRERVYRKEFPFPWGVWEMSLV